ncbi:MAG: Rpn family recombination-promoting nuclease/putative transposase [Spirochaetes bacterium]|nr:Rpn family recombination-promoting nuclease/putative transposase [Spirochaetota bacterium]
MDRISPTNDLAFKKVLASVENIDILQGFITDFYEIKITDLAINNPYSIADYKEILDDAEFVQLRHTIKDISATFKISPVPANLAEKSDFISELQVRKSRFFDERALYYPFNRFCQNYNLAGNMEKDSQGRLNKYSSLRPVYALNVLGYTHFDDSYNDNALHIFELYDIKRQRPYGKDLIKIAFFELTKNAGLTENQRHWLDYFNRGAAGDTAPDYIKRASHLIEFVNLAEEEKMVVEALEKADAIRIAEIDQGRFEGDLSRKVKIAVSLLEDGFPLEMVKKHTELSESEILALRANLTTT